MIFLTGADLVLPDRIAGASTLVIDGDRIVDLIQDGPTGGASDRAIDLEGHVVVPGFIDVHVHGVEGFDTLVQPDAIAQIAARAFSTTPCAFSTRSTPARRKPRSPCRHVDSVPPPQ